jgi:hypothetical protein
MSVLCAGRTAHAFTYQFPNGIDMQFDNTLQYSVIERTQPESSQLSTDLNVNDGDNNLRAGIVSNRIDLLTKFDVSYNDFGFDVSADSFYDTVYNQETQNTNPYGYNPASTPPNKFTTATQVQAGRDIQLRNLFIYGAETVNNVPISVRVGRLVNLWGESLLFAGNGISYGQAPIDIERALSVPNTQAKDLFLPVGQALVTVQPTDSISISAYYQFEWEKYNFPPAGSYFSPVDLEDEGGQRLIAFAGGPNGVPGGYFYRGPDLRGADTGQFGLSAHYDPSAANYDLGFYALQYNDSEPQIYVRPGAGVPPLLPGTPSALKLGTYQLVYPDHIQIYGASASTTYGPTNFAGEMSIRKNEPLVSSVTVLPGQNANNNNAPLYAIGNTLHYQASAIYAGGPTPLWASSTLLAEAAGDNLLNFVENRDNFNRTQRHMAIGVRSVYAVNYYDVFPGLDVNPSVGLGWDFMGLAPDTVAFNNYGIDRGGDITFGVSAVYLNKWTGGISYTAFLAPPGRDSFADRGFLAFNVERTI